MDPSGKTQGVVTWDLEGESQDLRRERVRGMFLHSELSFFPASSLRCQPYPAPSLSSTHLHHPHQHLKGLSPWQGSPGCERFYPKKPPQGVQMTDPSWEESELAGLRDGKVAQFLTPHQAPPRSEALLPLWEIGPSHLTLISLLSES